MAKKSNASNLRMKEEEQKQLRQTPRQQMPQPNQQFPQNMASLSNELASVQQALANSYGAQGLPASTQMMLQQLIASQSSQPLTNQMQATLTAGNNTGGLPSNLLETLALQNRMAQMGQQQQKLPQQRPAVSQSQMMSQQLAANFPGLQAQIAQSFGQAQQPTMASLNNARAGQLDPNQLLALQLLQQQSVTILYDPINECAYFRWKLLDHKRLKFSNNSPINRLRMH